ncbi:SAP domain-containing protein [Amycolatopsis kentuckyensis]|uniref:SAP domain-containing protein n=1 Tax=Amycolatopsis kentuckyensis TaxID=218823 RepID=UPI003564BD5C
MRVTYTHRLGQNRKGTTRDLSDTEARWLIERGHATATDTRSETATEPPAEDTTPDDTPGADTATLAELRAHADSLGLPTYGTKAQLAARIADHQAE